MASITTSTHVAAPLDRVFEVFTDLEKAAQRIPDIVSLEMLSDGPFGEGTRWRETRIMFKKEATEEMWITRYDPPNGYEVAAESHGMRYATVFSFLPDDGGTTVRWVFTGTPLTLGTRIMSPILNLLMAPVMRKCMRSDLEALRDVCQSGA